MGLMLFLRRLDAHYTCRLQQVLTFKLNIVLTILNTVLQVIMWYFMAQIVDPGTLGYAGVGYFPFILVGSLAMFFVTRVTDSFSGSFSRDVTSGLFKLAYLSNINIVEYFFINFFTSILFDFFTILAPMMLTYYFIALFFLKGSTLFFGPANVATLLVALAIFIIGNLGFVLMSVGSVLYLKEGDPISFFLEQFNRFFSGQIFPINVLPQFLAFLPRILPSAYIILIWRDTLFLNKTLSHPNITSLVLWGLVVNIIIFIIGTFIFERGVKRAKLEGRWF